MRFVYASFGAILLAATAQAAPTPEPVAALDAASKLRPIQAASTSEGPQSRVVLCQTPFVAALNIPVDQRLGSWPGGLAGIAVACLK